MIWNWLQPLSRLTLEKNRAQRSCERELEQRSRETKTFLTPLSQSPYRWITLLFVAHARDHFALRRSRVWSLRSSSLACVTQRWACSQTKLTRLPSRLVRNLKSSSQKRNRSRTRQTHSRNVSDILLTSSFQPVLYVCTFFPIFSPRASCLRNTSMGKNTVRKLQYDPRTRLLRLGLH